jgi:hypothetical protein
MHSKQCDDGLVEFRAAPSNAAHHPAVVPNDGGRW